MDHNKNQQTYEEAFARAQAEHFETQRLINEMQRRALERQQAIDSMIPQQKVIIAAVDAEGGFGKEGKIPWDYPEDFKWFQQQTKGHICVMGRTTYEEINEKMGTKGENNVLPDRKCFVVSTTLDQSNIPNATVIRSLYEVEMHINDDDLAKTIFFIGGARIFQQALSCANRVLLTVINNTHQCDRFFPTHALYKLFRENKMFKSEKTDALRFVEYIRK